MNKDKAETYEDWREEQGFERLNDVTGELYECPGGHVWHESDIYDLYKEEIDNGTK